MRADVARSTSASKKCPSTLGLDGFWKLRCGKTSPIGFLSLKPPLPPCAVLAGMIASYSLFIVDIGLKAKLSVDNRVRSCSPPHEGCYGLVSTLESCAKHWAKKQHQCPEKFGEAAQMLLPRGVRRGWKRF